MNLVGIEKEGQPEFRWQYNGQEKHEDFGLAWVSYKYRFYDLTASRFWSVDPIAHEYYDLTPYQFASNNPASKIELEGLEGIASAGLSRQILTTIPKAVSSVNEVARGFQQAYNFAVGADYNEIGRGFQQMSNDANQFLQDNPRVGLAAQGTLNLTMGSIGTASLITAEMGSGGTASPLVVPALSMTIGEMGIGMAQIGDALFGKDPGKNAILHASSSFPGLMANATLGADSSVSKFADALGQFGPSLLTESTKGAFGVIESGKTIYTSFITPPNALKFGAAVDNLLDGKDW